MLVEIEGAQGHKDRGAARELRRQAAEALPRILYFIWPQRGLGQGSAVFGDDEALPARADQVLGLVVSEQRRGGLIGVGQPPAISGATPLRSTW